MYEPIEEILFEVSGIYFDELKYFYPDSQQMIPGYVLESLGKYFVIKYYVSANHLVNMANRRSHYRIIIYVNN